MANSRTEKHHKKSSPFKKFMKVASITLLGLIFFSITGLATKYYLSVQDTLSKINVPLDTSNKTATDLEKEKPFSVLLMGSDARAGEESGRADTIILATANKQQNNVKMVSIPRDTKVEYDNGDIGKINASYSNGGPSGTVSAVEKLMPGVPVDYFISINMEGFKDLVDAVGGITVKNDIDLTSVNSKFVKGDINLNGTEALQYVRIRHEDPRGDFGRQDRQRDVIIGIANKVVSSSGISNFESIMKAVGDNFQTNMTLTDITAMATNYASVLKDVDSEELKGEGEMIYSESYGFDLYYFVPNEEDLQKVITMFKESLDITD
ncbi:LCP family glycopolymer transferase [Listeria seeligeri]|uniref:LCP family glycopolymer transferase n=1 Tax=Listeria seeligeri TaxID=1640 RepID=UPI00162AF48E|nr:LCP family protein [Listeria seeligeri]MBC1444251.1 LytR family transcriptional regulator [Listeria seeligeri]MBC1773334.1 LytR family transcriptional regulator [Listeria seeligeri]